MEIALIVYSDSRLTSVISVGISSSVSGPSLLVRRGSLIEPYREKTEARCFMDSREVSYEQREGKKKRK